MWADPILWCEPVDWRTLQLHATCVRCLAAITEGKQPHTYHCVSDRVFVTGKGYCNVQSQPWLPKNRRQRSKNFPKRKRRHRRKKRRRRRMPPPHWGDRKSLQSLQTAATAYSILFLLSLVCERLHITDFTVQRLVFKPECNVLCKKKPTIVEERVVRGRKEEERSPVIIKCCKALCCSRAPPISHMVS